PFLGTVLNKFEVQGLGWHTKETITLDDWNRDAPNVTTISSFATSGTGGNAAFSNNGILQQIEIPSRIEAINFASFFNTSSLNSITFQPGSRLTTIGNTAFRASALARINLPNGLISFGNFAFADMPNLLEMHIPDNVIRLSSYSFQNTPRLDTVTFGANTRLTQIWNRVFSGSGIRTIDIPDSVEVINFDAFLNTTPNLTTISLLVGFRGDDPTAPRYGFTQAQWNSINWKFKRPFLGTILTQRDVKNIGWDMKTTITLADWAADAPNVIQLGDGTNGGAPFRTNNVLRSIEIPEKVSSIAFGSFFRATNLTSVTFQAGSQLKIIAQEAFRLTNLSSIILPTSVIEIGIQAFMDTSITTLAIPDGVTDIF
ncbi:MAG: leucine-rich repeat domain-containing protein, partial [Metamycoplasmataceae bacterium]